MRAGHRSATPTARLAPVVPSLGLLLIFNGRTPVSRKPEIDRESLARLFAAVTGPYVACDGTLVNGDAS
jgi:hypothetical protein